MSLQDYQEIFKALRPDRSGGHARPHKMCMLLALMDLIEQGVITENKIIYNDVLKAAFSNRFNSFKQKNDDDTPHNPFYYLKTSKFWHHKIIEGKQDLYNSIAQSISNKKVKESIEFAYLDQELYQLLLESEPRAALISSLAKNFEDITVFFEQWAKGIGKSDKTIKNYLGAIKGSISGWVRDADLIDDGLLSVHSYNRFKEVSDSACELSIFKERNSKGNGMYGAALNLYGEFLADFTQAEVSQDIEQIMNDPLIKPTDKTRLVNTRLGQGEFRQKLIEYWHGCALTQYKNIRFLVASHIKPWKAANDYERLDVYNGILLLPNLDKAFDLGYISFSDKGSLLVSSELEEFETLGVDENMFLAMTAEHRRYMGYHREALFKG